MAAVVFTDYEADPLDGSSVFVSSRGGGGPAPSVVTYVNFATDAACAAGTAPTTWRTVGAPDPTGVSAPAFPCGGPWSEIWVGAVIG
jgi:hypothetical protein